MHQERRIDTNRRRQGGRGRRLEGTAVPQLPWTEVANPYPPMEVLSADQLEAVHLTSMRILEELGMETHVRPGPRCARGRPAPKSTRAPRTVRLDRGLVEQALASAPVLVSC